MKSRELKDKIYEMEEFNVLGGMPRGVSYPLLRKVKKNIYIVFPVYSVSNSAPSAFVICTGNEELRYTKYDEALRILGLSEDDFYYPYRPQVDLFDDYFDDDSDDNAFAPDDIYEYFDMAYNEGKPDIEIYDSYMERIMRECDPGAEKYLRAFGL